MSSSSSNQAPNSEARLEALNELNKQYNKILREIKGIDLSQDFNQVITRFELKVRELDQLALQYDQHDHSDFLKTYVIISGIYEDMADNLMDRALASNSNQESLAGLRKTQDYYRQAIEYLTNSRTEEKEELDKFEGLRDSLRHVREQLVLRGEVDTFINLNQSREEKIIIKPPMKNKELLSGLNWVSPRYLVDDHKKRKEGDIREVMDKLQNLMNRINRNENYGDQSKGIVDNLSFISLLSRNLFTRDNFQRLYADYILKIQHHLNEHGWDQNLGVSNEHLSNNDKRNRFESALDTNTEDGVKIADLITELVAEVKKLLPDEIKDTEPENSSKRQKMGGSGS